MKLRQYDPGGNAAEQVASALATHDELWGRSRALAIPGLERAPRSAFLPVMTAEWDSLRAPGWLATAARIGCASIEPGEPIIELTFAGEEWQISFIQSDSRLLHQALAAAESIDGDDEVEVAILRIADLELEAVWIREKSVVVVATGGFTSLRDGATYAESELEALVTDWVEKYRPAHVDPDRTITLDVLEPPYRP